MLERIRTHFSSKARLATAEESPTAGNGRGFRIFFARHPRLSIWSASALIVIGLTTLFALDLRSEYLATLANAERASQSFADVIAEHTARTFEAVERTLREAETIRSDLRAGRIAGPTATEALRHLQKSAPALLAIGWTNEAGDLVANSDQERSARLNIADLPHFIAQRDGKSDGMFIAPLYRSQAPQNWISSVSLRLTNADGSFAGIVSAPLDLSYFARTYRSVNIATDDVITVVTGEGYILFREPFSESFIGRSLKETSLFQERLPKSPFGTFETRSPIDGRQRIFAYRAVVGLPLVILVLQDRSAVLARWYDHIETFGPMVALLILVVIVGTIALARRTEQLTEKSALLEATLDNMKEGLIVVDRTDRIAVCNRRAMELLDLPKGLMNARPLSADVIDYQARRGEFVELTDELRPRIRPRAIGEITGAYERKRPNGTVLEILTVPFASGGVIRTYRDITAWKGLEQELKDREARYRLLADNSRDMIFQLDLNLVRQYVSPACREILGYAPEELVGQKAAHIIHPDDAERVQQIYLAVAAGLDRASASGRLRHKEGRWIWFESELRLVRDPVTDMPSSILGSSRDVSFRKALEQEAVAARQQAERAAEAKAQFLATMSHELRTPLNSIIGFTDVVLNRNDLVEEARRQIGLIQTASETLLTVVNDVLDFSKIEQGKLELTSAKFDLRSLIEIAAAIVHGSADAKNLRLSISVDPRISTALLGDDLRIRQVLLNLLNNAIKFTQRGTVAIEAALLGHDAAGQKLRLSVTDTGIGIPEHKFDSLFQHFSQVDGSTSRQYGGSGLGLAISKRLVEMMGGSIGVESTPGVGSTFWIMLELPRADQSASGRTHSGGGTSDPVSAHLLLVEDVEINREIACTILESIGYSVVAVSDGVDAIALIQKERFDLVLMDVQMPGMDGITATGKIRSLPGSLANIPIVAMTANVLPDQIEATRAAGMNGHVGKPFKRDQLREEIERCLSQSRSAPATTWIANPPLGAIDKGPLATLAEMLGKDKTTVLLLALKSQLETLISTDAGSTELAGQAHRLVSSAGMLGFVDLANHCSRLEQGILDGGDIGASYDTILDLCVAAMAEISMLISRLAQADKSSSTPDDNASTSQHG